MKKKILLTGASGFVGKNILELLGKQYVFYTPTHQELELTDENAVKYFLKKNPVNLIIHSANIGGDKKAGQSPDIVETNLRIFFNLVKNQSYYERMIFFGSGAEYDKNNAIENIKETAFGESIPTDSYGFYKYLCSSYIDKMPNIVNLRIFGIYGKYEDYQQRFISNNICRVLLNLPIKIYRNVNFDFLYIRDFVAIVDYFINHSPQHKFYNVGKGKKIDLLTLADLIKKISGTNQPIIVQKTGWSKEYSCDVGLLKKELPDLTYTDWGTSISELINYYQSIKESLTLAEITKYDA